MLLFFTYFGLALMIALPGIGSAIGVIVVGLLLAGFMFALAALGGQRMSQKKFFKAIAIGSWITLASFLYAGQ